MKLGRAVPIRAMRERALPRAVLLLALALPAGEALANQPGAPAGQPVRAASPASEIVLRALALLGVPYRYGGHSPDTGLDCSGLVWHVFQQGFGMALPRRTEDLGRVGEAIEADALRPGDLVFFDTLRSAFSHVGVYIGNGRFVHAPSTGSHVRIDAMARPYWSSRFNGARRLLLDGLGLEWLAGDAAADH